MVISTKFKVDTAIRMLTRYVTLWPSLTFDLLILDSGRTRRDGGSGDQSLHQVWRPYAYPFLS